ncbi:MAG: sulfite exporter TauE/SafE family protein [Thiothrix sp.]|nr:sulfite exporter TauE/SafE family protein [Thiothrix sp.]HPE62170.1 sulfite exporter TauE/SafE family protein [Thiolinea sp.]
MTPLYSTELLLLLAFGLMLTGAVAGILAGLLGVGGGIVIVPVLYLLLDYLEVPRSIAMHVAVATSLATIIPTSISSARSHHAKGAIDTALLKSWGPLVFLGAAAGGILSRYLASSSLTLIFGGIALAVAINMVLPKKIVLAPALPEGKLARGLLPAGIGTFSALMGIGGGTLSVPVLTAFSYPVHRAVGTASAFGLLIAVPAVLGFIWSGRDAALRPPYSFGYVSLPAAFLIFSVSVFTAPLGSRIAHSLNPVNLRRAFALFLFISGLRMLWSVLGQT